MRMKREEENASCAEKVRRKSRLNIFLRLMVLHFNRVESLL